MVKVKKAALGAFGMASLQAFGVGVDDDAANVPQQVSNQKLDMVLMIVYLEHVKHKLLQT